MRSERIRIFGSVLIALGMAIAGGLAASRPAQAGITEADLESEFTRFLKKKNILNSVGVFTSTHTLAQTLADGSNANNVPITSLASLAFTDSVGTHITGPVSSALTVSGSTQVLGLSGITSEVFRVTSSNAGGGAYCVRLEPGTGATAPAIRIEPANSGASSPWISAASTWNSGGTTFRALEFSVSKTAAAADSTFIRFLGESSGSVVKHLVALDGSIFHNFTTSNTLATGITLSTASQNYYAQADAAMTLRYYAAGTSAYVEQIMGRGKGTIASSTAVGSGDILAAITGQGYIGATSSFATMAQIRMNCDAAPSDNSSAPGRISFWTTPSGSLTITERWQILNAGHFVAASDNAIDIGASGGTRPRTGYFGTSVSSPKIVDPNKAIDTTAGDAATINAIAGRFRKDTSGATFTLTNDKITANSIVVVTFANSAIDATATSMTVSAGSSTATITFNAAPSANCDVNFWVVN